MPYRYGDVIPKKIAGKVFTMFWALVGICMASVYTAGIAAFLGGQVSMMVEAPKLEGLTIGVKNGTLESHLVLQKGAMPKGRYISKRCIKS